MSWRNCPTQGTQLSLPNSPMLIISPRPLAQWSGTDLLLRIALFSGEHCVARGRSDKQVCLYNVKHLSTKTILPMSHHFASLLISHIIFWIQPLVGWGTSLLRLDGGTS